MSHPSPTLDCAGNRSIPPATAFHEIVAFASPVTESQSLPLDLANGRVLARNVATPIPLPPFDNSAVDGYGITADDADRQPPIRLSVTAQIVAGAPGGSGLRQGEAVRILTGAAVPPGVVAVVMEERCRRDGNRLTLSEPAPSGMNLRRRGEDVAEDATIVAAGMLLDARHIAILAASGTCKVDVVRPIRVGILSNGNELRQSNEPLAAGQIHDANRPMLKAMLARPWIEVIDLGCHSDDEEILSRVFALGAAQVDVIISSGGVTGSDADHIERAVVAAGGLAQRFRLSIKPGKPILAGRLGRTSILGLPGNPVAAMVDYLLFGRPLVAATAGLPGKLPIGQKAIAATSFAHVFGRTEFVPARIVGFHETGCPTVEWLGRGGSARLRPLALADGFAEIPADTGELQSESVVAFHPLPAAFAA